MDASFVSDVGGELARAFEKATLLPTAEALAHLLALRPNDATGIGGASGFQPENYWYKEVGYRRRVRSFAASHTLDGDDRLSLLLMQSRLPPISILGYRVPWRLAIRAVRAILAIDRRPNAIAVTSDDRGYGFLLTMHVGYVPRELHDDETVYKVSRWHPLAGTSPANTRNPGSSPSTMPSRKP